MSKRINMYQEASAVFHMTTSSKRRRGPEQSQRGVDQANMLASLSGVTGSEAAIPLTAEHERAQLAKQPRRLRTLLVISLQPPPTLRGEIAAGRQPRRDYWALQSALEADILFLNDGQRDWFGRLIARILGVRAALTWAAFRLSHEYDIVYTEAEIVGLPFALLLKLSGTPAGQPRHVTLAHYLSPLKKRIFFRLGAGSHIDKVIVHAATQRIVATDVLHVTNSRVAHVPYFVDTHFWQPTPVSTSAGSATTSGRPSICAAGLEFRDYPTLIAAVDGLAIDVHIAASSAPAMLRSGPRSDAERTRTRTSTVPANVFIHTGYDYAAMRELYASARFVVVPLQEVSFQAGVTVILEAMAMGKAVIVSGNQGQIDVIRDRRNGGRGRMPREWLPGFLDAPEVVGTLGNVPTGFYVTPGDSMELRRAIQYLMDHPEVAEELGRNGRRVAESYFSLEAFAQRFAATLRGDALPADVQEKWGVVI